MSSVGATVPVMETPNKPLLHVTLPFPSVNSVRRKANFETDENGLQFVVYSGECENVELKAGFITDLLKLVKPAETYQSGNEEPGQDFEELFTPLIDPIQVMAFLNRWGMIGLNDKKRSQLQDLKPTQMALSLTQFFLNLNQLPNLKLGEKELLFRISPFARKEAEKLLTPSRKIRREYWDRVKAISQGDQIPYPWVFVALVDLAKCVRLVTNLLRGDVRDSEKFTLTVDNQRRILAAWNMALIAIPDNVDPAKYRPLDDAWLGDWIADDAEEALAKFTHLMNGYLEPLSSSIVRRANTEEGYRPNLCFETAFATYMLEQLRDGGIPVLCQGCQLPFFPRRRREDGKWCSPRCGAMVRNREKRNRDKARNQIHPEVLIVKNTTER